MERASDCVVELLTQHNKNSGLTTLEDKLISALNTSRTWKTLCVKYWQIFAGNAGRQMLASKVLPVLKLPVEKRTKSEY